MSYMRSLTVSLRNSMASGTTTAGSR
jgi:hypothetical protein